MMDIAHLDYTVFRKKWYIWFLVVTSANVDRFTKFLHSHIPTQILYAM